MPTLDPETLGGRARWTPVPSAPHHEIPRGRRQGRTTGPPALCAPRTVRRARRHHRSVQRPRPAARARTAHPRRVDKDERTGPIALRPIPPIIPPRGTRRHLRRLRPIFPKKLQPMIGAARRRPSHRGAALPVAPRSDSSPTPSRCGREPCKLGLSMPMGGGDERSSREA